MNIRRDKNTPFAEERQNSFLFSNAPLIKPVSDPFLQEGF